MCFMQIIYYFSLIFQNYGKSIAKMEKIMYNGKVSNKNIVTEVNYMELLPIILLVVMLVAMYFLTIRPQKKAEKEANDMRNNLEIGDEITTIGGIIGRVVSIKDETCVIETSKNGTKIRILKTAIRSVDVKAEDAQ